MSNADEWLRVNEQVEEVCAVIFSTATEVLRSVKQFGFQDLLLAPRPNAEDKLLRVKVYESILGVVITALEGHELYDLAKRLINAKEQILRLEMLINAVKSNDIEECRRLVDLLQNQADF
ncbi:hypothetical protein [Chromobacterium subtsugae]|uniref:hypothetical protein n=1 Tax=Chromobacterium subtsugae TaxID=251747 RepID=UPI0012FF68E2|nr:hypothetical protein [Chromobacterium subtsugae]